MARISAGTVVTGLTAAALAVVGFLAYQASAAWDGRPGDRGTAAASPGAAPAGPSADGRRAPDAGREVRQRREAALPPDSGTGERVVYSPEARRVWLVEADGTVARTYEVVPSAVDPLPGEYTVTSLTPRVTGSDGVPVEHVVVFAYVGETVIGFSAAVDGSLPDGIPRQGTGGIRERREDGEAMWRFAEIGTPVVVVP